MGQVTIYLDNSTETKVYLLDTNTFISYISILPFDSKTGKASAKIRAELEKQDTPTGPLDNLIAGTALCMNAIFVTHNTEEFSRIEGLTIEDWF